MCSRADNGIIIILGQYRLAADQCALLDTGLLSGINSYSHGFWCRFHENTNCFSPRVLELLFSL